MREQYTRTNRAGDVVDSEIVILGRFFKRFFPAVFILYRLQFCFRHCLSSMRTGAISPRGEVWVY